MARVIFFCPAAIRVFNISGVIESVLNEETLISIFCPLAIF